MKNILINLIENGIVDSYLDNETRNQIIEKIKNIKDKFLYKSVFHGLHHSEKVFLFAYIIGKYNNLSEIDLQILSDAAMYHDIGRIDETEDSFHGLNSAKNIEKVIDSEIYRDSQNLAILKAICDGHSRDDKYINLIADDYEIASQNFKRFENLLKILKDADALDRTRFMKTSLAALNEKYLRFDFSKQLVQLANSINETYRIKMSDIHFERFKNEYLGEPIVTCYHGIGFNFFNLHSILTNGLLSNYAKLKRKIFNKRNFYGSNNELWICVTTKDGEATKKFIKDFISLELMVPKIQKGDKNKSSSLSNGFPFDNGYYDDESFVFYEVPVENIKKINVNPNLLNTDIKTLNYLSGSANLDSLTYTINDYINNIRMLGFFPNVNKIIELLGKYKIEVINYEKLTEYEQRLQQKDFFATCDYYISEMNSEIQNWMFSLFTKKLNKDFVTVSDVITDILNYLNIDYELENGSFVLKNGRQL